LFAKTNCVHGVKLSSCVSSISNPSGSDVKLGHVGLSRVDKKP